jgi:hypothetical protein
LERTMDRRNERWVVVGGRSERWRVETTSGSLLRVVGGANAQWWLQTSGGGSKRVVVAPNEWWWLQTGCGGSTRELGPWNEQWGFGAKDGPHKGRWGLMGGQRGRFGVETSGGLLQCFAPIRNSGARYHIFTATLSPAHSGCRVGG